MKRLRKLFVPAAVITIGVLTLVGCIYIPGNFQPIDRDARPETKIGKPGSDKPLWIGHSTREDVIRVLGKNLHPRSDSRTLIYPYTISTGGYFFICGFGLPTYGQRSLHVEFGEDGRIKQYKVYKEP